MIQSYNFTCYYPRKISFPMQLNESVMLIENDKIYFQAWVEEGWDDEKNCASEAYQYYHKIIVKDCEGNLLSEKTGFLYQAPDGTWWIA